MDFSRFQTDDYEQSSIVTLCEEIRNEDFSTGRLEDKLALICALSRNLANQT